MRIEDIHYTVGQRWIQIDGAFTSDELRQIADEIDKHYELALKKPEPKEVEENNGNTE